MQAVNIGFSKDTALPCYFVQLDVVISLLCEFLDWDLQLGIDFVNDRARTSGALVIHGRNLLLAAGLVVILEHDDLRVLPAQFDHRIHFGMELLDRQRHSCHFLHELRANLLGNRAAARAGQKHARVMAADADVAFHSLQEFEGLLRLLGFMPLVIPPENLVRGRVDNYSFHRGRTDIQSNHEFIVSIITVRLMLVHFSLSA